MRRIKLLILLCSFLFSGCHLRHCDWNWGYEHLLRKPKLKTITGRYELTASSKKYLLNKDFENQFHTILLKDFGNFEIANEPDKARTPSSKKDNKKGKWSISCSKAYGCMIVLKGVGVVPLTKKERRLAILIEVKEGDDCGGLVYEKVN